MAQSVAVFFSVNRSLIQMATGSGKTFTAINFICRLIKFAGAKRVLFLVDRGNLGKQTLKEFQQYISLYNNFKFSEEYIVQRLTSNTLDTTARVSICTIQRLYSILKGRDLPADLREVERHLTIMAGTEAQINSNLRRADRLHQSILKKAFSGKLVPQNSSKQDQP